MSQFLLVILLFSSFFSRMTLCLAFLSLCLNTNDLATLDISITQYRLAILSSSCLSTYRNDKYLSIFSLMPSIRGPMLLARNGFKFKEPSVLLTRLQSWQILFGKCFLIHIAFLFRVHPCLFVSFMFACILYACTVCGPWLFFLISCTYWLVKYATYWKYVYTFTSIWTVFSCIKTVTTALC